MILYMNLNKTPTGEFTRQFSCNCYANDIIATVPDERNILGFVLCYSH